MTDGLYQKYVVKKMDTAEPVFDCFVLVPAKDLVARIALRAYAAATPEAKLRDDLNAWLDSLEP